MNKGKNFDIILANPPYDNGLHEKFDAKFFDICKGQICWVSPLNFLLGKKQNKRITDQLDKYIVDIEQINGNEYFDAAIGGVIGITYVDMREDTYHNSSYITFDGKKYNECSQITKFSNDDLLMEFFNKVRPDKLSDNLHMHILREPGTKGFPSCPIENNPNPNWWVYAISALRGNKGKSDFYTIISNQIKERQSHAGLYKNIDKSIINYYVPFNTENELKNFWNYIQTDFIRICLWFIKTSMNLDKGELKYIPWQDFTQEWNDEKLFKIYNISENEIKRIYEILPNYYNIKRLY